MDTIGLGRLVLVLGLAIGGAGVALLLGGRVFLPGRLPDDLSFRWGETSVFFPIVTCLFVSVVVTILFNVFSQLFHRP